MSLPSELIEQVRQRANFACEYCGVSEIESAGQLTIDHYRPRTQGGTDELDNLLYSCFRCNNYKADYWPEQPSDPPLWNPRLESRDVHLLLLADGTLHPISATGRCTLQRLRLNRPALVTHRQRRIEQREEANVLQQYQQLLMSLNLLHERLLETLEEHQSLLRTQRSLLTQFAKGNGQSDDREKPTSG